MYGENLKNNLWDEQEKRSDGIFEESCCACFSAVQGFYEFEKKRKVKKSD